MWGQGMGMSEGVRRRRIQDSERGSERVVGGMHLLEALHLLLQLAHSLGLLIARALHSRELLANLRELRRVRAARVRLLALSRIARELLLLRSLAHRRLVLRLQ